MTTKKPKKATFAEELKAAIKSQKQETTENVDNKNGGCNGGDNFVTFLPPWQIIGIKRLTE